MSEAADLHSKIRSRRAKPRTIQACVDRSDDHGGWRWEGGRGRGYGEGESERERQRAEAESDSDRERSRASVTASERFEGGEKRQRGSK